MEVVTPSHLDDHYRIVITKAHRDNLGWKKGQEIKMISDGTKLILESVSSEEEVGKAEEVPAQ